MMQSSVYRMPLSVAIRTCTADQLQALFPRMNPAFLAALLRSVREAGHE